MIARCTQAWSQVVVRDQTPIDAAGGRIFRLQGLPHALMMAVRPRRNSGVQARLRMKSKALSLLKEAARRTRQE